MPDYQKMYALACGAMSDALDALSTPFQPEKARLLLQQALLNAEALYINAGEDTP